MGNKQRKETREIPWVNCSSKSETTISLSQPPLRPLITTVNSTRVPTSAEKDARTVTVRYSQRLMKLTFLNLARHGAHSKRTEARIPFSQTHSAITKGQWSSLRTQLLLTTILRRYLRGTMMRTLTTLMWCLGEAMHSVSKANLDAL